MNINIDMIPVGKHLFTIAVTNQPVGTPASEITYDEIDIVADHGANVYTVIGSMTRQEAEDYQGQRVVGVSDQSDGYVIFENPNSEITVVL